MNNLLSKIKSRLIPYRYLSNIYSDLRYRWISLGQLNQLLIILGMFLSVAASLTTYSIASERYDLRETKCLALNIYHEARGEPVNGQYAVATVTMNRVNSRRYPNDVCHVVYQKGWSRKFKRYVSAFSWTNYKTQDSIIPKERKAWDSAFSIAKKVYVENRRSAKAKDALFYHATYVTPDWSLEKIRVAKIGQHIFYR